MNRSITLCLTLIALLISTLRLSAQDFVWGRSGGSPMTTQSVYDESIIDMACDKNGNVYILAQVETQGAKIDGQPLTGYGYSDVMLASYKPGGLLRWVKMIGAGLDDMAHCLGTDNKDGIYLSASVNKRTSTLNIDKDATSPKNLQKNLLVKYDTSGALQWFRFPEMDTFTTTMLYAQSTTITMDAGPSGSVYWLVQLCPGGYNNGALKVTDTALYLLKYSSSGAFSYTKPNIKMAGPVMNTIAMTVDEANGRFYLSGYNSMGTLVMNGNTIPNSAFIGCFKLDGSYLWHKTSTQGNGRFNSKAAIDGAGNIYLAGSGQAASNVTPPKPDFSFNGFIVKNGGGASTPILVKLDKNGNLLWGRDAMGGRAACTGRAVAIRNNDEVVLSGSYAGSLEWPGFPHAAFNDPDGQSYDIFVTRFNAQNGNVLDMDRIQSNAGYYDYPERMASDGKGNVYIGGDFSEYLFVNQAETLANTAGGQTDWFLLKYTDRFPVSVQQNNSSYDVKIYPNPAMAQLVIEGIAAGTHIQVMNMLGQQVLQPVVSKESKEIISTESLVPGSYLLQLTYPDGSNASFRIDKQ